MSEVPAGAPTRAGFVALIGAPNAGKSTLLNQLVGSKVSIVSHKVQTTRVRVRGIAIVGQSQIVFVDTPGIFKPRRRIDRAMVDSAWSETAEADVAALIVDAAASGAGDLGPEFGRLAVSRLPKILVLNKIDRLKKDVLLGLAARLNERQAFDLTFMVSALKGAGVGDLATALAGMMPAGPWLYPEDQISDAPLRQLAAEITREKLYHRLHDELPYASTVETTVWKPLADKSVRIEQTIYVERESQRRIVLGEGGRTIKAISMESRKELAEIVSVPVHLFLFVKVRENWGDDPERYREIGLEYPKDN